MQFARPQYMLFVSLCSTCVTYRMPCCSTCHQVLPTHPLPREAEDFLRGDKYPQHVAMATYLAYLPAKSIT